jgi:lactoylglutathione lyase
MRAIRFNHVSIHALDLERSVRFYTQLFGLEPIPTPTFRDPVQWLALGDQQLHLFERPTSSPEFHHIAIDVDDFEATYAVAIELGIQERDSWFSHAYVLPDGSVQFYLRDPAGNLVEIDWPDVETLSNFVTRGVRTLADDVAQRAESAGASLYRNSARNRPGTSGRIDAEALKHRLEAVAAPTLVDTRLPSEFAAGHLPGALLGTSDTIVERAPALVRDRHAEIVVYTGDAGCRRAARSAQRLRSLGYTSVIEYPGGLADWIQHGYPTKR